MAVRAFQTLISKSSLNIAPASASSILNKLSNNFRWTPCQLRGYRAAVLHEIAKPLVIEDLSPVGKLKGSEVLLFYSG